MAGYDRNLKYVGRRTRNRKYSLLRMGNPAICQWTRRNSYRWDFNFLSENGGRKGAALWALEPFWQARKSAQKLLPQPIFGWLRDGEPTRRVCDKVRARYLVPGKHGSEKVRRAFGYSYSLTGSKPLTLNNKLYTEPSIVPAGQWVLTWLRENAFPSTGSGALFAGYGAFGNITRASQKKIPSLEPQQPFFYQFCYTV